MVELMITVSVIGVLAAIAYPSMTALINNSRAQAQASELAAGLQQARSEAVRRNATVTLCPSTDGATCSAGSTWSGWLVHGLDRNQATPADEVIRYTALPANAQIAGSSSGIAFRPSGLIAAEQKLEVTSSDKKNCLTVKISGLVSIAPGACS